jgi:hypothetical protein
LSQAKEKTSLRGRFFLKKRRNYARLFFEAFRFFAAGFRFAALRFFAAIVCVVLISQNTDYF